MEKRDPDLGAERPSPAEAPATECGGDRARLPEIEAFAWVMHEKIERHNRDRGAYGWRTAKPEWMVTKWLTRYVEDLTWCVCQSICMDPVIVTSKAANVANIAMMIADVCGGFAPRSPAVQPEQPPPTAPAPTCSTCDDTHAMSLGDRVVPCTRCPTPCRACQGIGAYCALNPCPCSCHAAAGSVPPSNAAPTEGSTIEHVRPLVEAECAEAGEPLPPWLPPCPSPAAAPAPPATVPSACPVCHHRNHDGTGKECGPGCPCERTAPAVPSVPVGEVEAALRVWERHAEDAEEHVAIAALRSLIQRGGR
jgi:hypothetical protein